MLSPSFSFSATAMADYTTISGLGNERLLIMVNGHKLSGNTSGATDISRIDVSRIRRVEILKGASSSLYGSDAIGGVINIITDQPMNTVNASSTTRMASSMSSTSTVPRVRATWPSTMPASATCV